MILSCPAKVLRDADVPVILESAMKILENTGVIVENADMLAFLGEQGAIVDKTQQKVKIPHKLVEDMLAKAERYSYKNVSVKLRTFAGVYQGLYLDPDKGSYLPWNHEMVLDYAKLAQNLPNIDNMFMLGYPVEGTPDKLRPLYEKLYCWLYGIDGGKSIWETELCDPIYEMWQIFAQYKGVAAKELFNGTVYLISPLRFGKEEAAQFWYFYKKGLRITVGQLGSLGVTTPITPAGALSLHIAEGLFINYINHCFFSEKTLKIYNSVSVVDMSTGIFQYGRPEQVLLNTAGAQIAAYIGASFEGHSGLSDAKVPGYESAGQKVYSALSGALCYGSGILEAGLLAVDEINSPIQMILDDEMAGAIKKTFSPIVVNEESLALDVIHEAGPGGNFLECEHTFENFRENLWFPTLWSRDTYSIWKTKGSKSELDFAREKYYDIMQKAQLTERISPDSRRSLESVIDNVKKGL